MPASEPEIRANMLAGLDELLAKSYNIDMTALLPAVGLPPGLKPDDGIGIPLNSYSRLLELASTQTGDDCLGLRFAGAFPRGGMLALGFLILNAPDLGTCLDCLRRYVRIQCDSIDFHLTEPDGLARLVVECGPGFTAPRKQFLEFVTCLTVIRLGNEFGSGLVPLKAEFEYREPRCGGDYELLFGRNLRFDAPQTALTFRSDVLKSRSPFADDKLFEVLKTVVEAELTALDRKQDVVWQVAEYIVPNLAMRAVNLEAAATATSRSARQLQVDLRRQGTTFDDQVARIRRELAERYLRDSSMPMTEIALMLGFSELSAFTRAARGWFGMPPSQWRQQSRQAPPAPEGHRR